MCGFLHLIVADCSIVWSNVLPYLQRDRPVHMELGRLGRRQYVFYKGKLQKICPIRATGWDRLELVSCKYGRVPRTALLKVTFGDVQIKKCERSFVLGLNKTLY